MNKVIDEGNYPMLHVNVSKTKKMRWIDIPRFSNAEMEMLSEEFSFSPLDLKSCFPPIQRPKIAIYPEYTFLILQFPIYNRETRRIEPVEIDFFIGSNYLITIHDNRHPTIIEFFDQCQRDLQARTNHMSESIPSLLYELLNRLLLSTYPMLNHVSLDIDAVEGNILSDDHRDNVISEILILKRNIVNFRKIMQAHKYVIQKLIESSTLPPTHKFRTYFEGLIDHTKEIWDTLANYQDTVNAMHDAHASLINTRSNLAMRVLTAFAVIVFPLTLIATIFSMRTEYIPLTNHPAGFWYIVSGMAMVGIFMFIFFKRRKWL
ncbi:MAG: magnesium transporter CorA family protein [Patescibacteria group bacterium]